MRVAALAVGEEGEGEGEEEEEEEEKGEKEEEEEDDDNNENDEDEEEAGEGQVEHHHGARGPRMCPAAATAAVGSRSRWFAKTSMIILLLLLMPVWILKIVVDASPVHPASPHRGESFFFVNSMLSQYPYI